MILYHGSRPDVRDRIVVEGLQPSVPGMAPDNPAGVYLSPSFDEALSYGSGVPANPEIADVWKVDCDDLEVCRDEIDWRSFYTAEPIGPDRLTLVHAGTTTWADWQARHNDAGRDGEG